MILHHYKKIFGTFIIFSVLTIGFCVYFVHQQQNELTYEVKLTLTAVGKTLTYLRDRPGSLSNDVIFGVLLARANLRWITTRLKSNLKYNYLLAKKLAVLMKTCDVIVNRNQTPTPFILDKRFWKEEAEDLKFVPVNTKYGNFSLPKLNSCLSIDEYMMKGTPDDSDLCISELFNSSCNVSEKCWNSETNRDIHSGYKTSHRLIYLQIATKLSCKDTSPSKFSEVEMMKGMLCQQMLLEARTLHDEPLFQLTRDLFMEQIALCGFEGYADFATKSWRKEIRSWQNGNGCFGQDFVNCSVFISPTRRIKRTDSIIEDKCHTHVTAVGLSAMAFHLRYLLNAAFFSV